MDIEHLRRGRELLQEVERLDNLADAWRAQREPLMPCPLVTLTESYDPDFEAWELYRSASLEKTLAALKAAEARLKAL